MAGMEMPFMVETTMETAATPEFPPMAEMETHSFQEETTADFAIPDILGGPEDSLIGNVIKQQFLETRDWPFGSVLSIVLTVAALVLAGLAAWVGRSQLGTPSSGARVRA